MNLKNLFTHTNNRVIINPSILKKSVLKNGFVKLIDCMPSTVPQRCSKLKCDYAIVQAARVSEKVKRFRNRY